MSRIVCFFFFCVGTCFMPGGAAKCVPVAKETFGCVPDFKGFERRLSCGTNSGQLVRPAYRKRFLG